MVAAQKISTGQRSEAPLALVASTGTPAAPMTGTQMRALVQPAYGSADVLRFEDVEVPAVADDQVLLRVAAASVSAGDVVLLTGKPYLVRAAFGLRRPKRRVAGQSVAGVVVAIGKSVTTFSVGDAVYGLVQGGFAEYVVANASALARKPASASFEEAAAIPDSGTTALQALRDAGKVTKGQSVLINGASGGVGTFAVQIAKALGAHVTAVCSTKHVEKVRAIGADDVIDYTRDDFVRQGRQWDVIIDLVGNRSVTDCKAALTTTGVYVASGGSPGGPWFGFLSRMVRVLAAGLFGTKRTVQFLVQPKREDLVALAQLVDDGKLAPVIERRFAFADAAAAVRHVASGHGQGKSVIVDFR